MMLLAASRAGLLASDVPGTFAALMDLYERNYIHIRRLMPTMPPVAAARISQVSGSLDLHLHMIERSRYTSELCLTYQFVHGEGATIAEPNLRIRVYHDARLAEVMAAHPRHYAALTADRWSGTGLDSRALRDRWRVNRFLFKWLTYCLRQGHHFSDGPD